MRSDISMDKKIFKNYIYNLSYQLITLLLPIIVVPYISRILGKSGIGIYSYTTAISQYFIILGTVGITCYGGRVIAYERDNKEVMSKTFWTITILKFITTIISLIAYLFIFCLEGEHVSIYIIQAIGIISVAFDITYLFNGLEEFKTIVKRNVFVKFISLISIFIFVRSKNDLSIYVLINVVSVLIGNLSMWLYIRNIVDKISVDFKNLKKHFLKSLEFFIPQIAITLYTIIDKTMLGMLSDINNVGIYEQSQKIIKIIIAIITGLGTVMQPRMSNIFANRRFDLLKEYLNKSIVIVAIASIPMSLGMIGISKDFVPWFFGENFLEVRNVLIILSPIIIFIAIGNVLSMQYLIAVDKLKEVTKSSVFGLFINVVLNLILITKLNVIGASIATVISEFSVTAFLYKYSKTIIDIGYIKISIGKCIVSSIIMLISILILGNNMEPSILTTFLQVLLGAGVYLGVLILIKEEFIMHLIRYVKNKLLHKKEMIS